jgi:PRTRC genetic system ThiF family protein
MKAVHFTDKYLLHPSNPVTVNLIGAGGTGSNMLMALAKIHVSLLALQHPGLHVHLYDDDKVTDANQGRQLFAASETGMYKSVALINRVNRFFGTNWKAVTARYHSSKVNRFPDEGKANIFISCVDNVTSRFDIAGALKMLADTGRYERNRPVYWMDFGNSKNTGQAVLSTITPVEQPESNLFQTVADLPMVTTEFKELFDLSPTIDDTPSCSTAEALEKQDLFINPALVSLGSSLFWQLLKDGMIFNRGFFLNLHDLRMEPIKVG